MATDVRINSLTTDVTVTDASAMLTPAVLQQIVQAVMTEIDAQQQTRDAMEQERSLGGAREA